MRTFDWDGKPTPRLGFGCGGVLGRVGRRDSLRAMAAAWEAGVRLFDTARSYGYGEAEGLLGEFLRGRREQAIVVTKFGIVPSSLPQWKRAARPLVRTVLKLLPAARAGVRTQVSPPEHRFDAQTLRTSLETSLRELRTEYVDALLAHEAPASLMAQDDLMAELQAVLRAGKARRVGVSAEPCDAAIFLSQAPELLSVVQFAGNLMDEGPEPAVQSRPLRMVNHPFGGVLRGRAAMHALQAMAEDETVDAALRAKLRADTENDARERLAEATFASLCETAGADIIVASMLHPQHVRANAAAMGSDLFSSAELAQIRARLRMLSV